jgi:hypothetical protein
MDDKSKYVLGKEENSFIENSINEIMFLISNHGVEFEKKFKNKVHDNYYITIACSIFVLTFKKFLKNDEYNVGFLDLTMNNIKEIIKNIKN